MTAGGRHDATSVGLQRLGQRSATGFGSWVSERMSLTGPTLPTLAIHQVGSYLGYTGRDADLLQRAVRDSKARSGIIVPMREQTLTTSRLFDPDYPGESNTTRLPSTKLLLPQSQGLISSVTRAVPLKPRACAPAGVRSIIRPRTNGPRSFTLTTTDLPLPMFVTRTFVPKGRVRCAAVKAPDLTRSPFAVFGPLLVV